jgi:hypothetical protein
MHAQTKGQSANLWEYGELFCHNPLTVALTITQNMDYHKASMVQRRTLTTHIHEVIEMMYQYLHSSFMYFYEFE